MSEYLRATIYEDSKGRRLFINDTEFPFPISKGLDSIMSWQGDPANGEEGKCVVDVEIVVDEVRWVD